MMRPVAPKITPKEKQPDKFEIQFKKIIKDIIDEEKYFKEENVKDLVKRIVDQIDPLIAKHVKEHLRVIALSVLESSNFVKKSEKPINGDKIDA